MTDNQIMKGLFLFQNVSPLPDLTALPPPTVFAKGERIYAPDDHPKALGVILEGKAEAVSAQRDQAVLSVFEAGGVFGAASLFDGGAYVSCVRAVSNCRVQFLPEALLQEWFLSVPQIALNYIAFLTDRVRFLNGKIAVYTCRGVTGKLYSWLNSHSDESGAVSKLSVTKLAATLNMGRTSLYRGLEELTEKHLIVREGGKVRVIR